jgi:predicted DCC family thiol-disulfide oxidoreductase YuxK
MATAVLIYDGECASCRAGALWLMKRALFGGATELEIMPCGSPTRRARHPQVDATACTRAMQLVLPDGAVVTGAAAVPEILERVPRWRWLAGLCALPGAGRLRERAYAWIAWHRLHLACARETGVG